MTTVRHHPIQTDTSGEEAMSIIGMIVIWVFVVVIAFVVLNHGEKDKDVKRREIYWDKFEGK